jgi:hypothetical protein
MNNKICLSTKSFICIVAFILTFNFSFAKSNSEKNINPIFNTHTLKISTNPHKINTAATLTLSYDVANFCAGATGYSKPIVNEGGGIFSFVRTSIGEGGIAINPRTGIIDQLASEAGEYKVTYTKNGIQVTAKIVVKTCK